jgi:hypothetical protein
MQRKLKPERSNTLLVRVIEASDLPKADPQSTGDPYLSAKVKGLLHRTRRTPAVAVSKHHFTLN